MNKTKDCHTCSHAYYDYCIEKDCIIEDCYEKEVCDFVRDKNGNIIKCKNYKNNDKMIKGGLSQLQRKEWQW